MFHRDEEETMGFVFSDLGVTADGYAAGRNQTEEVPFGDGPEEWFHGWMFHQPGARGRARACEGSGR
jgi:hypothetical protein